MLNISKIHKIFKFTAFVQSISISKTNLTKTKNSQFNGTRAFCHKKNYEFIKIFFFKLIYIKILFRVFVLT